MHTYHDAHGQEHTLPEILYPHAVRLKTWGVIDLMVMVEDARQWRELLERIGSDPETIVNMAYVLEHDAIGTKDEQTTFGESLTGNGKGVGPLLDCGRALQQAVIDFFPVEVRDAIRQFLPMMMMERAQEMLTDLTSPESDFTQSDSPTPGNGSNPCSESSATPGMAST